MGFWIWLFILIQSSIQGEPIEVPTKLYEGSDIYPTYPGDAPLISDLTFRSLSDHRIDQGTKRFDPDDVKLGDSIYLNVWYLGWFQKEVHSRIKYPYILITCDVGNWLPDPVLHKLLYDPKLAAWFCRNIIFSSHPKIFQIPMGQTDRVFTYGSLPILRALCDQKPFNKSHLLYMNFCPRDYGDRNKIVKQFEYEPYCFSRNHTGESYVPISKEDYYKELAASIFVISPFGLESDCVRTWESLALGAIPIVEHSFLDPLFSDMPVFFIHDWNEINESVLKEKYEELKDKRWDKAFFDVWSRQIKEVQAKVRRNDLFFSQLEATKWNPEQLQDLVSILEEEENPFLVYKGFLSAIHSLQLAREAPFLSNIYLSDPWLYLLTHDGYTVVDVSWNEFKPYLNETSLLQEKDKVILITDAKFNNEFINYNPFAISSAPIFLDFSYYRNSLSMDFRSFRHNLLNELDNLYQQMKPNSLLLGNGTDHSYVSEVLERLSRKRQVNIERKGDFWFLRRRPNLIY